MAARQVAVNPLRRGSFDMIVGPCCASCNHKPLLPSKRQKREQMFAVSMAACESCFVR